MKKICAAVPLCAIAVVSFSFVTKPKPSANVGASLVFPVAGKKSNVGSFWGDARGDGGERSHEGIDIFAKKGTPVIAVADGEILSKHSTPLGGKVLWLQPKGKLWTAYYAHLDKQLVKEGDRVRKGQVIGTVGNTGNVRTTPAHLHFGVYTWEGAIDPYPVVKNAPKIVSPGHRPDLLASRAPAKEKAIAKKRASVEHSSRQYVQKTRVPAERSARYYAANRRGMVRVAVAGKWKKGFVDIRKLFVCR
jgi:murein DD-endopeptidase MepM/ murein hydrolase activator NlpD